MMRLIVFFCLTLILLSACASDLSKPVIIPAIVVDPEAGTERVLLSDIARDIEVIPLEMPEKIVFGEVEHIKTTPDYLLLHDRNQTRTITVFDRKGRYVAQLNRRGQGPGEYVYLDAFAPKADELYAYCRGRKAFYVYHFPDMTFKKSIPVDKYFINFEWVGEKALCFCDDKKAGGDYEGGLYFTPSSKIFEQSGLPNSPAIIGLANANAVTKKNKDTFYYVSQGAHPLIYEITPQKEKRLWVIDFGKHSIPAKYWDLDKAEDFEQAAAMPPPKATGMQHMVLSDTQISFYYCMLSAADTECQSKQLAVYKHKKDAVQVYRQLYLHKDYAPMPYPLGVTGEGAYLSLIYAEELDGLLPRDRTQSDARWEKTLREFYGKRRVFLLKYRL